MQIIFVFCLCSLLSHVVLSQEGTLKLCGKLSQGLLTEDGTDVLETKNSKSLKGVHISIYCAETDHREELETNFKSAYKVALAPERLYTITFSKDEHLNKVLEVSTYGITKYYLSKKSDLITDVTLFKAELNEELKHYMSEPVAKCSFHNRKKKMYWDMNHAQKSFQRFIEIISSEEKQQIIISTKGESAMLPK
ncbi:MAG: hypothetical protein AB8B53_02780 [Flavobacteriales bacterium]